MTPSPFVARNVLQFLEHTIEAEKEVLNQMLDAREPWQKVFNQFRHIEELIWYEDFLKVVV